MTITASVLYDLVQCPHRVWMDRFGDAAKRDPVSPFIELLWERGNAFEREVMESLDQPFTDLKSLPSDEKERETAEAMDRGDGLVYGGRVAADDLVGEPDILRAEGGGYVAGDIKSGRGKEDVGDARKPKKHYAVQLAFYTDILTRIGRGDARRPFVWDIHRDEVPYDLDAPQGPRTPQSLWRFYQDCLATTRRIVSGKKKTLPALASPCKQCHWYTACKEALVGARDLTLIPSLGRSRRDALLPHIASVPALAEADLSTVGKVPGIGARTLRQFQERARLQCDPNAKPYLTERVDFPAADVELFFDVETDPMRDVCYLHGFVERADGKEKYVSFFAAQPTPEAEERAFAEAFAYVTGKMPCAVYYYSPYERTTWQKLQEKYPAVASAEDIEDVFGAETTVDLCNDVVRSKTVWPTHDHSVKTLASYLGFNWRDPNPSGAASIEWYHQWTESQDPAIRQRILEYNEDDCLAMRVLLDGLKRLPVMA